jgi:hypothetical protein
MDLVILVVLCGWNDALQHHQHPSDALALHDLA